MIYRGLAAVIVGGVVVSMIFSLLLLPSLMRLFSDWRKQPSHSSRELAADAAARAA